MAYNSKHNITPKSVVRPLQESLREQDEKEENILTVSEDTSPKKLKNFLKN